MKKLIITLFAFCPFIGNSQELPYTITVSNQPFQQIDEGISLSNGEIWDDPNYVIPLGFNFQLIDQVTSEFITDYPGCMMLPNIVAPSLHAISPFGDDIIDSNPTGDLGASPISYIIEGEPGQRIAKIEWRDAAFFDEFSESGTTANRLTFQVWLYEGSNIIEYRYGPNSIKNEDIAYFLGGPMVGLAKNISVADFTFETYWFLGGDPSAPFVTPFTDNNGIPSANILLNATLPEGLVYRFTPSFVNVAEIPAEADLLLYPVNAGDVINVNWSGQKIQANIYDISGRLTGTVQINNGVQQLDIASLQAGTYLLSVPNDTGVKTARFIKR